MTISDACAKSMLAAAARFNTDVYKRQDLYSQMGEALTLDREEQDFKPIGELVDNYIRKLNEKPKYIPSGCLLYTSITWRTCTVP